LTDYCASSIKYADITQSEEKGVQTMNKMTIVAMLLATGILSVMGCAQNEAVKRDGGPDFATHLKTAKPVTDTPSQALTSSPAATPITDVHPNQIAAADSLHNASGQQTAPAAVVYFGFDSYDLTPESRMTLQATLIKLASKPSIQIEGHCDEQGSSEYNLALGEKRAKAAQNYLVTLGYPADRIATISYGKERPADQGHDEAAWAKNRRDELKIVR
jgi:peptidoglycan-associated lipoprotein